MIEVTDKLCEELSDIHNADTTKLAYIGDAVYEVFMRMRSAEACGRRAGDMNKYTVHYVRADSQAKAARGLVESFYTEDEAALFKRARNRTNTAHPRGCTPSEYKLATGFEAVIGWLYICGDSERLAAVVEEAVHIIDM
jgi:ribonuclease-3 family protein